MWRREKRRGKEDGRRYVYFKQLRQWMERERGGYKKKEMMEVKN